MKVLFKYLLLVKIFLKKFFYIDSALTKDIFFILDKVNFDNFTIVDVGAYKGLWISRYLRKFSKVFAYLIEPHEESFVNLQKKFRSISNVKLFKVGNSNINGLKQVNVNSKAYTNSLLELDPQAPISWKKNKFEHLYQEKVEIITLYDFVKKWKGKG